MKLPILFSFLIFNTLLGFAQENRKTIEAIRINNHPNIDGILNDSIWSLIPASGNFQMWQPGNEGEIPNEYRTEVKMAYDNTAVYVAAYMYDPNPKSILSQLSQRDEVFVQADRFYIALNTYNDGINETRFYVTSAGTIGDSRSSQKGKNTNLFGSSEDFNYNVVFDCKISKDNKGWYAEFKIPYNALRFPEIKIQDWSVNFYRVLIAKNETHTFNFINNAIGNQSQYNALISGVSDIEPPIRLTLFPFVQGLVSRFDGKTETEFKGGMDIKYGLSDSFTLDATLIPDFGQTNIDKVSLNLGPFEQTFGENRQFFNEGVDLFNKGGIFFSRRIGGTPSGSVDDLEDNETVVDFPSKVNLLNAIKISGRTKKGLGIGFFNAITEKTYANIVNSETEEHREVLVEPLSNYNIFVLDQQFNDNSSVSLINTNVTRSGDFRDANVTAAVFDISNKKNTFRSSGRAVFSNINSGEGTTTGFRSKLDFSKTKGNFIYTVGHDFANTTFDINDLGLNFKNNYNIFEIGTSYQIYEPTKIFNRYNISFTARHRRRYQPSVETSNSFNLNSFFMTPNRLGFGGSLNFSSKRQDYFEPRVEGKFVTFNPNFSANAFISTDFRKKFAYDIRVGYTSYFNDPQQNFSINFQPRFRFSNHLLLIWMTNYSVRNKSFGYIDNTDTDVFFGQRDVTNVENSLTASYNINPFKAIDIRFRNSWSTADYSDNVFTLLNDNGSRTETNYDTTVNNPNTNFNIWNLDLSYRWRFAPGSEATLLYRNQIFNLDDQSTISYNKSLGNLFDQPIQHIISLRLTYFIDYNNVNNIFKKKSS